MKNEMSNEKFFEEFGKLSKEERDEIIFKALGGTKKKSKYMVDTYYKGLGYYVGGWYGDDLVEVLEQMRKAENKDVGWHDLPQVVKAKEKFGVKYMNDIMTGRSQNPFVHLFVCNADDMRLF